MLVVEIDLRRSDLARAYPTIVRRSRYIGSAFLLLLGLFVVVDLASGGLPKTRIDWIAKLITIVLVWSVAALGGLAFGLVQTLTAAARTKGVLGRHTYKVTAEGLVEVTSVNESLLRWGAAESLVKGPSAIVVVVGPWHFHVLPRRDFTDAATYDAFWSAIQPLLRGAA